MNIDGKVAVITGGASGLGEATARAYVEKGARVAVFDLNEDRGNEFVRELGDAAQYYRVDVTSEGAVRAALTKVANDFGPVHICNSYAGVGGGIKTYSSRGPYPLEEFRRVVDVNLVGTFNVARLVCELMVRNEPYNEHGGRGVVINTASVAAYEGQVGQAAYSASKAGIVGMTLPMARDLAVYGIRVNTIVPGLIRTPILDKKPRELFDRLATSIVYPQRMGRPDEVAHLSVMIVENEYMNGECIRLDGALRMPPR
jgi:3-hydroxyacyl-CoA dehydrogenase / 3-hydroxy-2-methylbutyryl-CoA dehydrogenase